MKLRTLLFALICGAAITGLFSCEKAKDLIPGGTLSLKMSDSTYTSNKNLVSGTLLDTLGGYMLVVSGGGQGQQTWLTTVNVFFPEKKLQTGTYSSTVNPMNAIGYVTLPDMTNYASYNHEASVGSSTIVISKISNTHVEGTFSGLLLNDMNPDLTISVESGKFDLSITP